MISDNDRDSLRNPSDPGDQRNGHASAQSVRGQKRLWLACELQKLAVLTERFSRNGKVDWAPLARAWERSRQPDQAVRTLNGIKYAYNKYIKGRENAVASLPRDPSPGDLHRPGDLAPEVSETSPGSPETEATPERPDLEGTLTQRSLRYYRVAIASYDRRAVKRPAGEIPKELLEVGNAVLSRMLEHLPASNGCRYISNLNAAVYAVARAVAQTADELGRERCTEDPRTRLKELQERRASLISVISTLTVELRRRRKWRSRKEGPQYPSRKFLEVANAYNIRRRGDLSTTLRKLKDRLHLVQLEIRKLEEDARRKQVRRKGIFFVAREPSARPTEVPVASILEYWRPIVGEDRPFEVSRELEEWSRTLGSQPRETPLRCTELEEEAWRRLFSKVKPWKATGPDGIQGFWWKHLPAAREGLKSWCLRALRLPRRSVPTWFCQGRVVLIPKRSGDPGALGPGDFRPIACLNTCYKILTACMTVHVSRTVGDRFPGSQVALRKGIWGCTHAHVLDQTIVKDAERNKKELHMMWVDMTKAFDSLRHGAIMWIVKQWGVPSDVRRLLSTLMALQGVRYHAYSNGRPVRSQKLQIRNGLMQGDSLSPLLFCLCMAPASAWIQAHIKPYETGTGSGPSSDGPLRVSHVFYMDDLKVFTPDWYNLMKARDGIQAVVKQLGLELNKNKCAIRSVNHPDTVTRASEVGSIPILGGSVVYKYLGAEQTGLICLDQLWTRVAETAMGAARRLFLSNLTVRQKVNGFNQVVVPKLKYAISCIVFGTGRFSTLRRLARTFDGDVRKLLVESRTRFKTSCTARLYVGKNEGGLGLKLVEEELEHSIVYTWCYVASNADFLVSYELAERLRASNKRSVLSDFQAVMAAHGLEGRVTRTLMATIVVDGQTFFTATEAARAVTKLIRSNWAERHMNDWKERLVAARVLEERGRDGNPTGLCMKDSFLWSAKGWVSSEVLRNVWAAQEATLLTRGTPAGRALRPLSRGYCRMHCGPFMETAEHVVSACGHWRSSIMLERHDEIARVLYFSIRRKYGITVSVNTHRPHTVEANEVVVYWDTVIPTSEGLKNNRPDLVVWDRRAERIWIIEVSVSWYSRILAQEQRKLGKYAVNSTLPEDTSPDDFHPGPNLKAVLQRDRKCRVDVIPIVVGACGEVSPNLRTNIQALQLGDDPADLIEKMQQCAVMGTNRLIKCHLVNP